MRNFIVFSCAVLVLSVPFYVVGHFWPMQLPFGLPITSLMILVPAGVATVMASDRTALWQGLFDLGRVHWAIVVAALLLLPAVLAVARLWAGTAVLPLPWGDLPLMLLLYVPGAALEEVGWTGYLTPRLQPHLGVVGAGVAIGIVWALWHVVPLSAAHPAGWVMGQAAATVVLRVLMGKLYAGAGQSLALATLFHATINIAYSFAPNEGAGFEPARQAILLVVVLLVWTGCERVWPRRQI